MLANYVRIQIAIALLPLTAVAGDRVATRPLKELTLEELLEVEVVTPSKGPQSSREAPSIITIITREDIVRWGFHSVAEALVLVPGVFCTSDYVAHDCGVRGVSSAQRGYNRIFKVMIDGHAVPFRSDHTSFLGPELIPIEVVERIEVVRGPASALYGANAFFGVINVITRDGEQAAGGRQVIDDNGGVATSAAYLGTGADGETQWSLTLGATATRTDYDGRVLPSSSPLEPRFRAAHNVESRDTFVRPWSVVGALRLRHDTVDAELLARHGVLDTTAEFLDFGILTHENRMALHSSDVRLKLSRHLDRRVTLTGALAWGRGGPTDDERLSTGAADSVPRRKFGYEAVDVASEVQWGLREDDSVTAGVDLTVQDEDLIEVFSVDRATGEEIRTSAVAGDRTLHNTGVYVQGIFHPIDRLGVTGNLRYDRHSVYRGNTNVRVGAVLGASENIGAKALVGTSYKAPAPLQQFAQPLFPGELIGNEDLRPETARMLEGELSWRAMTDLVLHLNAFASQVEDKVELVPVEANLQPQNVGRQEGYGLEAQGRWIRGPHVLLGTYAYQNTDTIIEDAFGEASAPSERYPRLVTQLRWQVRLDSWGTPGIAARYVSPRRASSDNVNLNLQTPYELPAYATLDLAYYKAWGAHVIHLRVDNLFDANNPEAGFGGIDIPRTGRRAWLSYSYGL